MKMHAGVKFFLDILPLAVFFIGFKWFGLFVATSAIIITSLALLALHYWLERRIALSPLITAIVVAIFGGLTLYLHDETFIKIKPTLINLIFAGILLGGCMFKRGFLRHVMGAAFNLTERGWWLISLRFGLFFLFLAALNEFVWRHYPTATWVNFKVFGLMGLTMLFTVLQVGFLQKHQLLE